MATIKYKSDYMSRKMDKELDELEEKITALYVSAVNQVTAKFTTFAASFADEMKKMQYLLSEGAITKEDYYTWVQRNVVTKTAYKENVTSLTNILVNTDKAAMATVRGELPYVLAQSYNFTQALGWKAADEAGMSVGTFQVYNAKAVEKIIRDNPSLLPAVDIPADQKWNKDRINTEITQGIIQGDSIPQIATRLQNVTGMDKNAALRTARTSMTYAENLGRDEGYLKLKAKGIPVKKIWSAVIDSRTRDTHRLLNGTYANEDGLFGEGILDKDHLLRCPADPNGEPHEIYNCRCREGVVFDKPLVDHSNDDELYEDFLKTNYPDDYEKLKKKDYFNTHTTKPTTEKGTKTAKKGKKTAEKQPKTPTLTGKTASNRKEADKLLKDMGFGHVSSGVKNINEQLYIDNVNRLSALNTRFNAVTPNMKLSTGKMNSVAYVRHEYSSIGSTELKLSTTYFKESTNALLYSVKGAIREWKDGRVAYWMPVSNDDLLTCSITHEYGHMLQNKLIMTKELTDRYKDLKAKGQYYQARQNIIDAINKEKKRHKNEIIAIAKEINPDFDLIDYLSMYGRKNESEFFAECFMNAFCGSPNILGQAMLEWLRRNNL